jgi:hypothetical protein
MDPAAVRTKAAEVLAKQRQLEKEKLQKQQQVSDIKAAGKRENKEVTDIMEDDDNDDNDDKDEG